MSAELNQLLECTCRAIFGTESDLLGHLQEQQVLRRTLSALLEQSLTHSKVEDINDAPDDPNDQDNENIAKHRGPEGFRCPYGGCQYTVKKKAIFRRHFRQHVPCDEACVSCPFRARAVSDYLGHVSQHQNIDSPAKRTYMLERCRELRELVDIELAAARGERLSDCGVGGKRTREMEEIDPNTPRVQRARLESDMIMGHPNTQIASVQDAHSFLPTQQQITQATSLPDSLMPLATSSSGDSDTLYQQPVFAPIFSFSNYPDQGWG